MIFMIYLEPISRLFCLQKRVFSNQSKGHLGSRCRLYIYIYSSLDLVFMVTTDGTSLSSGLSSGLLQFLVTRYS